jgi:DNA-binding winged helix-turn-helix (wHTH) protein
MTLKLHKDLLAGRYRSVVDELLDRKSSKATLEGDSASLIGALSFLGRMDEAEALYARLEKKKASSGALTVARFFLGIGFTRLSEYTRARKIFAINAVEAGASALERFYVHQGNVLYAYYTGRYRAAIKEAGIARKAALRSGDLFARALATDAFGVSRVVAGELHHGLRLLEEARTLAAKLGNQSVANATAVSLELYDAEFALSGEESLPRLEKRWAGVGTEDNYSLANVGLELARQYTLRGRFQDSAKVLEITAPTIYANQNRRQEIQLNLRLAELACQKGDAFSARHYLRFLRRLLHREADSTYELAAVGIERKLALSEGKEDEVQALTARWKELARDFGSTRDDNLRVRLGFLKAEKGNQEDRVHRVLQVSRLASSLPQKLKPLLEQGYLCEAAACLGLPRGANALALLPEGLGALVQSGAGITWLSSPLSSLQAKILRVLDGGDASKEKLVETVWGYRYDPLRHDATVYSALSALRRSLGPAADWVLATDSGYRFSARLYWQRAPKEKVAKVPDADELPSLRSLIPVDTQLLSLLNHRQIEILEWLRERRFLAVGEIRTRFNVSEITALRDFDGLRQRGLVVRNGKARATRYTLPETGARL